VLLVSSLLNGKAWKACAQQTEKNLLPHKLCSFMSSLRACPASSASTECIFSIYDLVCSKIRKSLDAEKAEKLLKIYRLCRAEENKPLEFTQTVQFVPFFSSPLNFVTFYFVWLKKQLQITVWVSCLFYFVLSRYFKGKVKSVFLVGFIRFF